MKITRSFHHGNRYDFDFGLCSSKQGWAQIDTGQDASYFGIWANPTSFQIVSFAEGDLTLAEAADGGEFAAEIIRIADFHGRRSGDFARIDPGFDPDLRAAFEALGLGDLLH